MSQLDTSGSEFEKTFICAFICLLGSQVNHTIYVISFNYTHQPPVGNVWGFTDYWGKWHTNIISKFKPKLSNWNILLGNEVFN